MRATICPKAIILTYPHRATVSIVAKGCLLGVSYFNYPTVFTHFACIMHLSNRIDKKGVLQQEYFKNPLLPHVPSGGYW